MVWVWWSSKGDNPSFNSKTKFKIHHLGILCEKLEQGIGKKKKTVIQTEWSGHVLKLATENYWGLKCGCQKPPTYTETQPCDNVLFMCDKSYRGKHRLR